MIWKKWNTILQLKENGKINRMGMLFSTKNKDYYYDTGTGKVVELELGEKEIFSSLFDQNKSNDVVR